METAHELEVIRPWRRATIAVTLFAAVEFVVLAGVGMAFLGNPLANHFRASAARAGTPLHRDTTPVPAKKASLARNQVSVMVLNGNGQAGAAHAAADRVQGKGYLVGSVGNAREASPRTLIMYRPGFAAEGVRLGRDLRVRLVRPLDGLNPSQLMGSHLVLILGR